MPPTSAYSTSWGMDGGEDWGSGFPSANWAVELNVLSFRAKPKPYSLKRDERLGPYGLK